MKTYSTHVKNAVSDVVFVSAMVTLGSIVLGGGTFLLLRQFGQAAGHMLGSGVLTTLQLLGLLLLLGCTAFICVAHARRYRRRCPQQIQLSEGWADVDAGPTLPQRVRFRGLNRAEYTNDWDAEWRFYPTAAASPIVLSELGFSRPDWVELSSVIIQALDREDVSTEIEDQGLAHVARAQESLNNIHRLLDELQADRPELDAPEIIVRFAQALMGRRWDEARLELEQWRQATDTGPGENQLEELLHAFETKTYSSAFFLLYDLWLPELEEAEEALTKAAGEALNAAGQDDMAAVLGDTLDYAEFGRDWRNAMRAIAPQAIHFYQEHRFSAVHEGERLAKLSDWFRFAGRLSESGRIAQQLARLGGHEVQGAVLQAEILAEQGDRQTGLEVLDRAARARGPKIALLLGRADILEEMDDPRGAYEVYREALNLDPENYDALAGEKRLRR